MTTNAIDAPTRTAARLAGAAFLAAMALVVVSNYAINFRLLVPGDAVATARNILAHESLFRLNLVCNLAYAATLVVLLAALYTILKPAGRTLALAAAGFRLVAALMWGLTALHSLGALRLLGDAAYLQAFQPAQLQALARVQLASSYDAYYVGLPFWALASTACGWLWFRSGYIPKALALSGVAASAWGVLCAAAFLAVPHFDRMVGASWYDLPLALFEITLGLWLLFKGLRPSAVA